MLITSANCVFVCPVLKSRAFGVYLPNHQDCLVGVYGSWTEIAVSAPNERNQPISNSCPMPKKCVDFSSGMMRACLILHHGSQASTHSQPNNPKKLEIPRMIVLNILTSFKLREMGGCGGIKTHFSV